MATQASRIRSLEEEGEKREEVINSLLNKISEIKLGNLNRKNEIISLRNDMDMETEGLEEKIGSLEEDTDAEFEKIESGFKKVAVEMNDMNRLAKKRQLGVEDLEEEARELEKEVDSLDDRIGSLERGLGATDMIGSTMLEKILVLEEKVKELEEVNQKVVAPEPCKEDVGKSDFMDDVFSKEGIEFVVKEGLAADQDPDVVGYAIKLYVDRCNDKCND